MNDLRIDILPEEAQKELFGFYEYLTFKYAKKKDSLKKSKLKKNKNLEAFYRFKELRNRINPVVDNSIDIDKVINEVNNDIF